MVDAVSYTGLVKQFFIYLAVAFLAIVLLWIVVSVVRFIVLNDRADEYIENTMPYTAEGDGVDILVLGDSLAYGTGTTNPEQSVAGLIANYFENPNVENRAENGKKTDELAREITEITDTYDLILIIIGGNDILRPTVPLQKSGKNLETIYKVASEKADHVIAYTTGDLKHTTLFLPPLNYYYSSRSKTLRNIAQSVAEQYQNVTYVDMVAYNKDVPFTADMEAEDGLHLSDKGAGYWVQAAIEAYCSAQTNNLNQLCSEQ